MASANSSTVYLASAEATFDFSQLGGGVLAGTFLACAVWGVSCLQVHRFIYFMNCDKDPIFTKYFVGVLWVLDTVNQFLLVKGTWRVFIWLFGSPTVAAAPKPEHMQHGWIATIVFSAVQFYFIRRIYIFAKSSANRFFNLIILKGILATMIVLTVWELILIILYKIGGYRSPELLTTKREVVYQLSFRAAAVTIDVVIAACMVYLLTRQAPRFKRSRKIVHRLIIITISSGAFTALLVTAILILIAVYTEASYWCTIDFPLCSVYLSTLLANLNTREYIRGDFEATTSPDIEMSTTTSPSNTTHVLRQLRGLDQVINVPDRIHIHVQRHTEQDGNDKSTTSKPEPKLEHACSHDDHVVF